MRQSYEKANSSLITSQQDLLIRLQASEQQASSGQSANYSKSWFKCLNGQRPVLVSAPHACRHQRDGVEKMAEEFTAAFACILAQQTNCHAIFTTNKTTEDPNWVLRGEYKKAINEMVEKNHIGFLVDLHGMTNRHNMGLAIGTMRGRSCPGVDIKSVFLREGFALTDIDDLPPKVARKMAVPIGANKGADENENWRRLVIDHPLFTGGLRNHTVTRYATEELGISAVQIEIASVARIVQQGKTEDWPYEYSGNTKAITACVRGLCALIEENS